MSEEQVWFKFSKTGNRTDIGDFKAGEKRRILPGIADELKSCRQGKECQAPKLKKTVNKVKSEEVKADGRE